MDILKPVNPKMFDVQWETTLKCNLDCSYCGDGHDNKTDHPDWQDCLSTADFIVEYTSRILDTKPVDQQYAGINIQGGESFFQPGILNVFQHLHYRIKDTGKNINISTITNGIVGKNLWHRMMQYIDYYTVTFHAETEPKQIKIFKHNVLGLKVANKQFQVNIMMHPKHWEKCVAMVEWCKKSNVPYHLREIDHHWLDFRFNYNAEQVEYLRGESPTKLNKKLLAIITRGFNTSDKRACCGGAKLCADGCTVDKVENRFEGWHCSVDKHFLYVQQHSKMVYTNKDCRMNWDGGIGPIGTLNNTKEILDRLGTTDTIVCKKKSCWCGVCAPKARTKALYDTI